MSTLTEDERTAPGDGRPGVEAERHAAAEASTRPATIIDVLLRRAAAEGARPVYTFLANGDEESSTQTFAELDRQARSVAVLLRDNDCRPGDRALLLYPPGEREFFTAFVGCLYAGVVAVPVPPPHAARIQKQESAAAAAAAPPTRLRRTLAKVISIASDSRPSVALTTERLRAAFEGAGAEFAELRAMRWLATDGLGDERAGEWEPPRLDESALAFLQYTSGSTAAPKGVMVTHANLLANADISERVHDHTAHDVLVSWLPTFHDLGLMYGLLQPIYTGFRSYVMPPAAFIQRPARWLRALSRYGGTLGAAPNFAYDLCVRKTTPEERAELDLSRWRVAINGAEPVRAETLEAFAEAFAASGFRRRSHFPSYGLAEATLYVAGLRAGPDSEYLRCEVSASALERHRVVMLTGGGGAQAARDARTLVACGHPSAEIEVRIVNPETCAPCAPDEVGEIWVSGPNIAAGYWRLPEVSERTFRARLANGEPGQYLRTGDLGFISGGQIVMTGRHKDLIIVGGANFYPQDIELTAETSHPDFRRGCSAAFSVVEGGEERVVVAVEVDRPRRTGELPPFEPAERRLAAAAGYVAAVRRALAEEHEIQVSSVALLKAGSIPKTSSGKIQRQACRKLFLEGGLELWGA